MHWTWIRRVASVLMAGLGCRREPAGAVVQQNPGAGSLPKTEWIDPALIQLGPIRRESLTKEQEQRIRRIREIFTEVRPSPEEKWFDDFKRDADPDREIAIWERMARAYQQYCSKRQISREAKKEVFTLLLMRSAAPEEEVIKDSELRVLSIDDAKEAIRNY